MLNPLLTTTTRITITLPTYVHQQLVAQVPKGEVSQFVTYSLEKTLMETKTTNKDVVDQLFELGAKIRKNQKKPLTAEDIKAAIERGRE